jgi:hypothetical protein
LAANLPDNSAANFDRHFDLQVNVTQNLNSDWIYFGLETPAHFSLLQIHIFNAE